MIVEWASIYIMYDASIKLFERAWAWHVVPVSKHLMDTESGFEPWDLSKAHILVSSPEEPEASAGSGSLEWPKEMVGMDSLNKHDKHVEQISFRQCVTFCEHRQLKGWQPHFQPTKAKSSISTTVPWFAAAT